MKGLSPQGTAPEQELKNQTKELLNYFFIGISLPNEAFWVNLRPDAEDNIIDRELAETDVGKILLEADLQLKKDTANFTSPQTPEGKEYWDKLYKKAEELYGSENITIPTLTRPWIVPDEIIIRESKDNAYIYKATLKVMLEQDYLKDSSTYSFQDQRSKALNEYSSQLIKETIIPKLAKEINSAKRYAPLRQVYYSLILAQWFKQKFYGKSGVYSYLIDRHNLNGLTSKTSWSKTTYFNAYKTSFQQGEYNIKEPRYTPYGQTIRSYMSGGIELVHTIASSAIIPSNRNTGVSQPLGEIPKFLRGTNISATVAGSPTVDEPYNLPDLNIEVASPAIKDINTQAAIGHQPAAGSPVVTKSASSTLGIPSMPTAEDNLSKESEMDVIDKAQVLITKALAEQVNKLREKMSGGARIVNIGSTSRDTHIFEIDSKEFDLDFMILFQNPQDLESFETNYIETFNSIKDLFKSAGFEIKHIGKVKNRAGDSKISYFINNGGSNFKLEVNLSTDKKVYADWFKEQESQILALGGDAELVKYDIKRMKRLVTQLGIYNIYEGGLGAVGIEQLVIQSSGYSEQGRRIEGVGSFHQALEWICRAGLNKTNEIIPLKQAKKNFKVFDPETGEDLVNRLNENSWAALVGLAKEFSSRKGYGGYYGERIKCFEGKKQASAWDPKQINSDNVEGYLKRMLVFGSGHFATHITNSELLKTILQQGYLMPRVYVQHHMDLEGNGSRLAYPTESLHFIIDSVLERWKDSKVAFFAAVEPLLEHKAYPYLPESGREWEVTGFSASAYDKSNRFYINELGIIFVPREWQEDKEFQELLSSLAYRPRIYYYEGTTVQEGIKNLIEKYHIRPRGPSLLSGYVERVGHKDNKSVYANISPWSEDEKINMIDLPHTAEECAEIVLRVYSLPEGKGYRTEIYQFARQAYELDPNSAKANLVKALYYPFYEPTPDKDSSTKIREVIDYLEKAIGLGLPEEYKFLALDKLTYYYRQVEDFDNMIKAKERYLNLANSSNQEHYNYKYAIKEAKENKKILDEFIQRIDKCRSLDDLSLLVKDFVPIPDYNMRMVAYKKFYETFKHLTNKALDKLYKNAMDKIFLEQEKAIKEGGYFAPYSIKDGIESGLAPLANSIGSLYKDFIEIVSQGVSKNEYEAQTYSYSADGIRYRFMSTIDPQIEKAKKEIIRGFERLLAERRLGDKIAVLNKEVYDETIDQDPKSIYNYFDGVRSQLEALLIILKEIKSAGGNTEKAEEQIGQFAKKAEAKIGAGLEKMGRRNFVKRFFDFVRGKEIVIPKNYKEILQSYLTPNLEVKQVNPASSPAAVQPEKTTGIYSSISAFRKMLFQRKQRAHLNDIIKELKKMGCPPAVYEQAIGYALNSKDAEMALQTISLLEQKFSTDESNQSVETLMIIATLAEPQIAQYAISSLAVALTIASTARAAVLELREIARCPLIEPQIAQYAISSLASALVTTVDFGRSEDIAYELFHLAQEGRKAVRDEALSSLKLALSTPGLNPKIYERIAKLFESLIRYAKKDTAQEVISFLESTRNLKASELDPAAFKAMGYTLANTGWQRRGLIRRTSIFPLEQEDLRKKLAVIIHPIEDDNGAFKDIENKGKQLESRGYQVIIARVGGIDALLTALKAATARRRASVIMIGGHGSRTSIQLGFGEPDSKLTIRDKQLKEKLSAAVGTLEKNGIIILDSCSTGKGGRLFSNIAQLFADTFPQGFVFTSPYPVVAEKGIRLIFNKENEVTAVEFLHAYWPNGYYNSVAKRDINSSGNLAISEKVRNSGDSQNGAAGSPVGDNEVSANEKGSAEVRSPAEFFHGTSLYALFGAIMAVKRGQTDKHCIWSFENGIKYGVPIFKTEWQNGGANAIASSTRIKRAYSYAIAAAKVAGGNKDFTIQKFIDSLKSTYTNERIVPMLDQLSGTLKSLTPQEFKEIQKLSQIPIVIGMSKAVRSRQLEYPAAIVYYDDEIVIPDQVDFATEVTEIRVGSEHTEETKRLLQEMGLEKKISIVVDTELSSTSLLIEQKSPSAGSPVAKEEREVEHALRDFINSNDLQDKIIYGFSDGAHKIMGNDYGYGEENQWWTTNNSEFYYAKSQFFKSLPVELPKSYKSGHKIAEGREMVQSIDELFKNAYDAILSYYYNREPPEDYRGEIRVSLSIKVSAKDGKMLVITVTDNGLGANSVPSEQKKKCMFFMGRDNIGLGMVEKIVKDNGGIVDVKIYQKNEDAAGVGARVKLEIPLKKLALKNKNTKIAGSPVAPDESASSTVKKKSADIISEAVRQIYSDDFLGERYGIELIGYVAKISRESGIPGFNPETILPAVVDVLRIMDQELKLNWGEYRRKYPELDLRELRFSIIKSALSFQDPQALHGFFGTGTWSVGLSDQPLEHSKLLPLDTLEALKEAFSTVSSNKHPIFTMDQIWHHELPRDLPSVFAGAVYFILKDKLAQRAEFNQLFQPQRLEDLVLLRDLLDKFESAESLRVLLYQLSEYNRKSPIEVSQLEMIRSGAKVIYRQMPAKPPLDSPNYEQEDKAWYAEYYNRVATFIRENRPLFEKGIRREFNKILSLINVSETGETLGVLSERLRQEHRIAAGMIKDILAKYTWINGAATYPHKFTSEVRDRVRVFLGTIEWVDDAISVIHTIYYNPNDEARNFKAAVALGEIFSASLSASSSIMTDESTNSLAEDKKGGIDMRALPKHIVIEPMNSASPLRDSPLSLKLGSLTTGTVPSLRRGQSLNLDKEWQEIERMASSGIAPSCERIREYLLSLQDPNSQIDKVLACIAGILRQEEEKACCTESSLREILVLLESNKPVNELRLALAKIQVLAKEPQLIEQ